ncbi:hypothetical protein BO86DRAFT_391993 [Aspergillus japonicus CBS 114.51]|uniref:Zn(2)-C6 fungal-type domain-containing protein n=1 Tax=Aspergillus japonicus CBS 114.51 TaxID=1448312 RepID=A0A8T8WQP5_ASPJA|nr:hypothetical protein BO86DRAFT_391993 [Aspergillus japonicus CBS 114.51]RAH78177.1 hypothetical protein BO86DRAFT_391993 [Aspergillus japonicus CBS 114.51]
MSHEQVSRVVKPPCPTARRRQNTSCDPCRRSKRRCVLLSLTDGGSASVCTNCKRLKHHCTFDFIKSVSSRPRKRKGAAGVGAQLLHLNQSQVLNPRDGALTNGLGDDFELSIGTDEEDFTSWLNFDMELSQSTSTDIYDPFSASSLDSSRTVEALHEPSLPSPSVSSRADQHSLPAKPQSMLVGRSRNSPIHLLNSKLEATVLDECLASIYNAIVRDSASRFIDYECNLSASGRPYYLESRFSDQAELGGANKNLSSQLSATREIRHPRMTMLGAVRFLDHFSHLYGNKLSTAARKQSDTVLKAVLRVFSLQWLPTSEGVSPVGQHAGRDVLTDTFYDSWMEARSLIQGSLPVLSFRVVCAILLFDGIVMPSQAYGRPDGTAARMHEFLDTGLQKLSRLDDLVRKYCCQLGPASLYGTLLHSSLDIIRWGGYIRDIGAALFTDHRCKLPELLVHRIENDSTLPPSINHIYPSDLDASIPRIYRTAVARAFAIWRMMIKVKDLVPPNSTINIKHPLPPTTWEIIASTMTAVDDYNYTLRPFMSHCMENYAHLSTESKIYALSVLTFWDLGTLIFGQTLTAILHQPSLNHDSPLSLPIAESQIRALQKTAVISIAQAIECSLTHPVTHDTFNLQNGLSADLPLTAYHITPTLMVTALRLAIEIGIELWLGDSGSGSAYQAAIIGGGGVEDDNDDDDDDDDNVWQKRVDVLVKGLLSLEVTIGGSQAVGPVLEGLLRRYGDVVSECWSCEF